MQGFPKIGSMSETRFTVTTENVIEFAETSLPPVLATPWLIWHMEHAALQLLEPFLDPGEISVGTQVDVEHLAAALIGDEVVCTARLIHHEGSTCTFQVEAHHEETRLAKGLHKRRIVETERLARRLRKSRASPK